jgi:hypothetical protein
LKNCCAQKDRFALDYFDGQINILSRISKRVFKKILRFTKKTIRLRTKELPDLGLFLSLGSSHPAGQPSANLFIVRAVYQM